MTLSQLPANSCGAYYTTYLRLVDDIPLMEALKLGKERTLRFFDAIPEGKHIFRYETNKWTPKDILQHMVDCERVFSYRALYFARTNHADLEGFDENLFADNANAVESSIQDLMEQYEINRNATLKMFEGFSEPILLKMGKANKNIMSVGAAGFIICGHELHHINIIKERYLK